MKKQLKQLCLAAALFLTAIYGKAQMSGPYAIPGDFPSLAVAIGSLNSVGISGPVTININASYTETVPVGGFTLNAIVGASSTNTITFQKAGVGPNPVLYGYVGTAIPSSAIQDGIWRFNGADYITVDGIDLMDPNTANPATMEFGFGFFKASATDGCQNNTIRNCFITLNRINNAAGAGPAVDGSRGIDVVNASMATHTTAVSVSAASGANSNNQFYLNVIDNCNIGIAMIGFADSSPFAFADMNNDIGGTNLSTGNTIRNFGGGGTTSAAAGIRTLAQYNVNVGYNLIVSNNGSGVDHAQALRGIYLNTATSANATVRNNTVTVKGGGTTQQVTGIENASGSTAANNTITITNNLVTNCTYTGATSGNFYGIQSSASPANVIISSNAITSNSTAATSGNNYMIYNSGSATNSITISDNMINGIGYSAASTSLVHKSIYVSNAGASASAAITGNTVQAINYTGSSSGAFYAIHNEPAALSQMISNNLINNLTIPTSATSYIINSSNSMAAAGIRAIINNTVTSFNKSVAGGILYGYYSFGASNVGALETNLANNFSNINVVGATSLTVWQSADGPATSPFGPTKLISNNTFTNITAGTYTVVGLFVGYSNSTTGLSTISGNTISTFACACSLIVGADMEYGTHNVTNNTISSFTATGATSTVQGIAVVTNNGITLNISKNRITDLQNNAADGTVVGIHMTGGTTNNIYNNLVGNLRTPSANLGNAIMGINIVGGTTNNVYYNTVNLNATSIGANFGTTAFNVNATPTTVDVRNNIFVNTSTPTGTGITVAYRRISNVLTNYAGTSNNNLFYAGTPGASRVIFHDGTTALQTISAFKGLVLPREAASVTENPTFQSTSGTNANFLNINTATPTQIEGGALPIATFLDDYAGTTRNVTKPDIGAWEGTFTILNCGTPNGGVLAAGSATICAGQTLTAISNNASIGAGSTYLWKVGGTPGGPYVPVTGGTGSTTTAYQSPTLAAGVYYVVLQASCAVTSQSAVSNEGTLTVNAVPTASANITIANICAGGTLNLNGSSGTATSYTWTGPGGFLSTSQNTVINNATAAASGNYSLVTATGACVSTVAVVPATVNAVPSALTVSPLSALLCQGASQTITANGGAVPNTLTFGTQANQNGASTTASGYPGPYSAYYGGQRMQMLVLASELTTAGFSAGSPLTSIQFPVVSLGSNWGTSITSNQSFQVNMGHSALATLSTFQSGLTPVVLPANFTPLVGYNNTHNFSAPFIWNGTDNVIIETTWSNNFSGTAAELVVSYNSPTTFQATIVYRADSQPAATMATANTVSYSYSARPDFKLNGQKLSPLSWGPAPGLSSTSGRTVVATPAAATIYTVTALNSVCSSSATISTSLVAVPSISIAATSTALCAGDLATLTATGADSYTLNAVSGTNTFVVNPTATTIYTIAGQNQTCTAVTQTISITSNTLPVVAAAASPVTICLGNTSTLTASGASTYVWVSGPSTSNYTVSPATNTTYSVTGTTAEGCSGQAVISVSVEALPVLTITPASATVCAMTPVSFTASGANTYSWTSGGNAAATTVTPNLTGNYVVTGTNAAGCSASQTVAVNVNALPSVSVTPGTPTICVNESLVLTSSGASTYSWMTASSVTSASISVSPTITTSYTVEGTDNNNCKNTVSITVTVDQCTGLKENTLFSGNVSLYPNPSSGIVNASFSFEGSKEIFVLNSVGALVMKTTTEDLATSFDLSNYAKGVYFVRLNANGSSANYRIMIQ